MVYGPPMRTTTKMQCARCGYSPPEKKVEQLKSHKVRPKRVKPLAQRLKEDKDKMDMEE